MYEFLEIKIWGTLWRDVSYLLLRTACSRNNGPANHIQVYVVRVIWFYPHKKLI